MDHAAEYREWRETPDGKYVFASARSLARTLVAKGFKRFGAKALWERIRFDRAVDLGPDHASGYKLNNNYTAFLARELMETYPDLAGLFETRAQSLVHATHHLACGRGTGDSAPVAGPAGGEERTDIRRAFHRAKAAAAPARQSAFGF